jgi:hypothetical protein
MMGRRYGSGPTENVREVRDKFTRRAQQHSEPARTP